MKQKKKYSILLETYFSASVSRDIKEKSISVYLQS